MGDLAILVLVLGLMLLGWSLLSGRLTLLKGVQQSIRRITKIVGENKSPIILPANQGTKEIITNLGEVYKSFNPELDGKISFIEFQDHLFNIPMFLEEIQNSQNVGVELVQSYRDDQDYYSKVFKLSSPDKKNILILVEVYRNEDVNNLRNKEYHKVFASKANEIYIGRKIYVVTTPGALAMKVKIVQGAYDISKVEFLPKELEKESVELYLPVGDEDEYVKSIRYDVAPFENVAMCKVEFGGKRRTASVQGVVEHLYHMMSTRSNGGLRNVIIRGGSSTGKSSLLKQIQLRFSQEDTIQMMLTPEQLTNVIYQDSNSMKIFNFMRNRANRQNKNIVLYVDEAEDLLYSPAHSFKSFLDGSLSDLVGNPGIIMTTSKMDPLDPELARPGRLDVVITLEPLTREEAKSQAAIVESSLEEEYTYDYATLNQILDSETPYSPKEKAALGEVFQGISSREDWDELLEGYLDQVTLGEAEFISDQAIELPIEPAKPVKKLSFLKKKKDE